MTATVASSSFSHFWNKKLTYDETKVFFSESLLLNILTFFKQVPDS